MGHHRGVEAINAATGVTTRQNGLRKTQPYWYEFQTYSKLRWFGRELIEIMTTEFRDRTKEYYVWAIHKGICTVNAKKADLHQILGDGDKICNSVHRHEPPVTDEPIKIIHRDDDEGILVIVKPGSIPVHAAGRYLRHTLVGLLQSEHGIDMVYTTNRLDRLTSGIMVCSTKKETASRLGAQFAAGQVNKAYVCRVRGKFPQGEVVCKQPILTIDRQSGVNIVHPKGKHCETIFVRLSYDASDDSSVVFCRPITGRTHQIRVHVQYLGHPICNDPIYGHDVWSKVDSSAFAEVIPDQWKKVGGEIGHKEVEKIVDAIKGDQDGQEDWARWKDEVLFKDMIAREGLENVHVPGPNGRSSRPSDELLKRALAKLELDTADVPTKGLNRPVDIETAWQKRVREQSSDFCPECKIPLLPDPKPEELYIYLHAIKYWTDEWSFEDALPWWAREDWQSITPHGSGTAQGAAEATLPEGLAIAHKSGTLLSSTAISSLITSEIEEKASRLAEPQKYAKHDQGVELTQVRQLVDYPVVDTGSSSRSSNNEQMAAAMEVVDVPVVFQVFGGFEDFAQREILQQTLLRASGDEDALTHKLGVSSSIHSGHVKVLDNKLAGHALQVYFDAKLGIAKTAYLLTAVREFPRELAKELKHEKHIGGASKRAKWKAKELRKALQKKEGKKLATQPTTPGIIQKPSILQKDGEKNESSRSMTAPSADGKATISTTAVEEATSSAVSEAETDEGAPFPSEVKLLELLDDIWEASRSQLDRALESWKCIVAATTGVPVATSCRTYRATVDRATYNLPSLNTQTMERYVGELAWDWLNGPDTPNTDLNAPTNWRVDLEKPMVDITLKFLPGFGIGDEFEKELGEQDDPALKTEGQIAFMIKLPPPATANPRRPAGRNALLVGGTAMAEYRAASLALALPLPTERKTLNGVQSGPEVAPLRVLEACCGHGSLVFETAAMMEARGLHGQVLGCDIDNETIERARCISNLAGFSSSSGAVSVQLEAIDGTDCSALQSFVGGSCSVDAIITDLPWGKREKASQSLSKLYHLFLESWFSVLRTGGYILTVTAEHRTLSRALSVFETTCRKKRLGACLRMEDMRMLDKNGSGLEQNKVKQQGVLEAQRNGQMRKIEIGYHVYVFMIRKIAI